MLIAPKGRASKHVQIDGVVRSLTHIRVIFRDNSLLRFLIILRFLIDFEVFDHFNCAETASRNGELASTSESMRSSGI